MKYYIRQIKPYIKPPQLQGFNDRPFQVKGYDWVSEDLEEELRREIVVTDPWSYLFFAERYIEAPDGYEFMGVDVKFKPIYEKLFFNNEE